MGTLMQTWSYVPHFPRAALLADAAVKGVLILISAAGLTLVMHRAPASSRHLVWSLSLVALLLLPVLPRFAVPWRLHSPVAKIGATARPAWSIVLAPTAQTLDDLSSLAAGAAERPMPRREAAPHRRGRLLAACIAVWLAGALLLAGRIVAGVVQVRRLLHCARKIEVGELLAEAEASARRLGIVRRIRLFAAPGDTMPLTWGFLRPVVLLPAGASGWSPQRREVVLLHELAHVRRWDCMTQLVGQIACALHWFNPLAWLAAQRLLVEREQACDELVLLQGTRRSDYAAHLVSVAQALRLAPVPAPLTAPLACRTRLESRVAAILGARMPTRRQVRLRLAVASAAALALIVPQATLELRAEATSAAPAAVRLDTHGAQPPRASRSALSSSDLLPVQAPVPSRGLGGEPAPARREAARSVDAEQVRPQEGSAQSGRRAQWSSSAGTFEVTTRGHIELTANETAIAHLAPDSLLKIEHEGGNIVRRLEVTSTNGSPIYTYTVDGQPRPFTDETQRWLSSILPEIVSATGFGAAARVARLDRERGPEGVFAEVSGVRNPRVRAVFLLELLKLRSLTEDELRRVADKAVSAVLEGYLPEFLFAAADYYLGQPGTRAAYLDAIARIPRDVHRSRLIIDLLQRPGLAGDIAAELIRTADSGFETDNLRAAFLGHIAEQALADETLRPVFLQSFGKIATDVVLARLAADVLNRQDDKVDDATRLQLLQMAYDHMHSDRLRAGLLIEISDRFIGDPALEPTYRKALEQIRDRRARRKLEAAVQEKGLH